MLPWGELLYRYLKSAFLLKQNRFAEALACLPESDWTRYGLFEWACYRHGLHGLVSGAEWKRYSFLSGYAHALALATVGKTEQASSLAHQVLKSPLAIFYRRRLISGLAPYAPLLARELLQHHDVNLGLKVALEAQFGDIEQATFFLEKCLSQHAEEQEPDIHLLASNLLEKEPIQKLDRLNKFLEGYGLAPVTLKNSDLPPAVGNLQAAHDLSPVNGPLVSVLMTTFNTADRVSAAIEGVLNQTYSNLELIVCDDCSTDATADVVREWQVRDQRVKFVQLKANVGTYGAKTQAFHNSKGEFITCHDSDDWSHPQRIEKQIRPLLNSPKIVATTSNWLRVTDTGEYRDRLVYRLCRLNPASPLFRRKDVEQQAGLWDSVRIGADSEFRFRLQLVFGHQSIVSVALPLTFGAQRQDSLMNATETGFSQQCISPIRLAYWEAWARWHISCVSAGKVPKMRAIDAEGRDFPASEEVLVSKERIRHAFSGI